MRSVVWWTGELVPGEEKERQSVGWGVVHVVGESDLRILQTGKDAKC